MKVVGIVFLQVVVCVKCACIHARDGNFFAKTSSCAFNALSLTSSSANKFPEPLFDSNQFHSIRFTLHSASICVLAVFAQAWTISIFKLAANRHEMKSNKMSTQRWD